MHTPILEVVVPDGEPRIPRSLWDRPGWVLELGSYGRAAYEWRRALAPMSLDLLDDPVSMFRLIDQTVSDRVRWVVQDWLAVRDDPTTMVEDLPQEFAEAEADQIVAATRAAEIRPCLELVYLPAPAAPGDLVDGTKLTVAQVELLTTTSWETRPLLEDLRLAARELGDRLADGDHPEMFARADLLPLTDPTAMFPTEVRVATQLLAARLGRPVDLYQMFN